ncbi:DUF4157 domain-containing protein [Roseobacter sp.]|uniref:eCIS core domain-containing protein n=1 Tax=Roseobacter sp. TaxID=1907202 RepID=UPI0038582253
MAHIFSSERPGKSLVTAASASQSVSGSNLTSLQSQADHSPIPNQLSTLQRAAEPVQRMEEEELLQGKASGSALAVDPVQLQTDTGAANGLPSNLKAGVETLSGVDMSSVQVHYNSAKPAQLQAHAYAQGQSIHLGPGQEKHLPHEAWHVAQQAQGRVQPTMQMAGQQINDDVGLESEADRMGAKAVQAGNALVQE